MHVHVCICMQLYARACVWRSEDSLRELVLSLSHMDPRDGTQVFGLGSKYFYLLSHLADPSLFVYHLDNLYCLTDFTSTRGGLALCGVGLFSGCAVCSTPHPQPPAWTSLGSGPGHAALQLPVDVSASLQDGSKEDRRRQSVLFTALSQHSALSCRGPCHFRNRMEWEPAALIT